VSSVLLCDGHDLGELTGTPRDTFAEVPTALFARVRARNRVAAIDAAAVQALLASVRQDLEDAGRDLALAIGRLLGEPTSRRDRRRESSRRLNGRGEVVHE
jgi:hypothetical protein